jgi:hypothetical protein
MTSLVYITVMFVSRQHSFEGNDKWWIRKDLKGNSRDIIKGLLWNLPWDTEEKREKSQPRKTKVPKAIRKKNLRYKSASVVKPPRLSVQNSANIFAVLSRHLENMLPFTCYIVNASHFRARQALLQSKFYPHLLQTFLPQKLSAWHTISL